MRLNEGYMDPFKYDTELMYDETWKKRTEGAPYSNQAKIWR